MHKEHRQEGAGVICSTDCPMAWQAVHSTLLLDIDLNLGAEDNCTKHTWKCSRHKKDADSAIGNVSIPPPSTNLQWQWHQVEEMGSSS